MQPAKSSVCPIYIRQHCLIPRDAGESRPSSRAYRPDLRPCFSIITPHPPLNRYQPFRLMSFLFHGAVCPKPRVYIPLGFAAFHRRDERMV